MDTSKWTLEGELRKVTGAASEAEALLALNIIPDFNITYQIRSDKDWTRGGAETYIFRFWVSTPGHGEKGYIIKACVSFNIALGIEGVINEWLSRRRLLSQSGVTVPNLVYAGHGVIIEELIPWELREYLRDKPQALGQLFPLMVDYAAVLSKWGFAPVDGFYDLRTRGMDVVVIDFGEDLGPPRLIEGPNTNLFETLLKVLEQWGLSPDKKQLHFLRQKFAGMQNTN